MARKHDTPLKIGGLVIPPEERSPLVDQLLHILLDQQKEIERLRAEIDRLRGLPETPKRRSQPSTLDDPQGRPSRSGKKKKRRGKRPGSAKRHKTKQLEIRETIPLRLDDLSEGTRPLGFTEFFVQDLKVESHNIRYRRARYQLPGGGFLIAPLPEHVTSHFGPTLRSYVLYQHYQNHVTEPLLLEELRELGVDISVGQISRLLSEGHDAFHAEKGGLLPAAREEATSTN